MEGLVNPRADFWNGRSVLITGHTGFKGSWLTFWLEKLGAKVSGLALAPGTEPSMFKLVFGQAVHQVDIRDLKAVRASIVAAQPQIIFHMAAQSLVRQSYHDPVGTYATNVMGTVHLLEAARDVIGVEAIVVVTSDKCYDNREWPWAYRETEPMGGYDPYSNSKGCAELVTSADRASFFAGPPIGQGRLGSARAGNVIGGGDWAPDRLIPDIIRAFGNSRPVEIRQPRSIRPWQHVLEPLSGYICLAERLASKDGAAFAEGWNFGPQDVDCQPVSYIVERLATLWGDRASWFLTDEQQPHEAAVLKVDASMARSRLGWNSRLRLDEALAWTVEWYKAQSNGQSAAEITAAQITRYECLADASLGNSPHI